MGPSYEFLATPAIHERLRDAAAVRALAARPGAGLRIEEALVPGLGAVLATYLGRLPVEAGFDPDLNEVSWRCVVNLPPAPDPQHPEGLYRLARFLEHDLPALARAWTGRELCVVNPFRFEVTLLRKGSYLEPRRVAEPAGDVEFWLWLTGARWPADWGGHLALLDDAGALVDRRAPGSDSLDLLPAGQRYAIPVLIERVEALAVRGRLVAAAR